MAADALTPNGKRHALLSTPSWIAIIVGILSLAIGAVFVANAATVTNTVAEDRAIIQEIKDSNKKQDDLIQAIAQNVAMQTANVNNLTEAVRNLTSLIQGHLLGGRAQ